MATVAEIQSAYERVLGRFDTVTITQGATVATARGRIHAETSVGLTDAIEQGRLRAIILAADLSIVPDRGDILEVGGKPYVISAVDDATRRVGGVVIAYEVTL